MNSGTLFLSSNSLQEHIMSFEFKCKNDNEIGLQIADFIPNACKKFAYQLSQRKPSIISDIYKCAYDGGIKQIDKFGVVKL